MRQSETAGVRLDERKAMGCNASVRSIGCSGRLWRTRCAIALAEEAQKRRPGSQIHPESGGCRLKRFASVSTVSYSLDKAPGGHFSLYFNLLDLSMKKQFDLRKLN